MNPAAKNSDTVRVSRIDLERVVQFLEANEPLSDWRIEASLLTIRSALWRATQRHIDGSGAA